MGAHGLLYVNSGLPGMAIVAFVLFATVIIALLFGYPVAFTLAGVSLIFAAAGILANVFEPALLQTFPSRLFGIMTNETLIAVPLFVFMGVMLERSKIAEELLDTMASLFGSLRGGLGISVVLVGVLLAASTGIVGATVVTMVLLSLPTMLKSGYQAEISTGVICASGTLGQIIPPSIILILLGDVLSSAYQQAQLDQGIFSPDTVSVGDLFAGAVLPGLLLVVLYLSYLLFIAWSKPQTMPAVRQRADIDPATQTRRVLRALVAPVLLMIVVLGSIAKGIATPTEAASIGAVGAFLLGLLNRRLDLDCLRDVVRRSARITCMVFMILIGASIFSLVFRGYDGDVAVHALLMQLPGGVVAAMLIVMLLMFLLGFILDFIEITFVVVPIVGPVLLSLGVDPVWLGVMIAINLQTSFLTPPFGFALFYLRGVAPKKVQTRQIYRGVVPFIAIQVAALLLIAYFPGLATWLPDKIY